MRTAETVLGIIRARGTQGQPLDDVYRQLYNPALYLRAYHRIARNNGAMTPGVTPETVDGMSLAMLLSASYHGGDDFSGQVARHRLLHHRQQCRGDVEQ
jgi:hypothetical protein